MHNHSNRDIFPGVDLEHAAFGLGDGLFYLTKEQLRRLLCDPLLGLPVALLNLSGNGEDMAGMVYRGGSAILWPCTPRHLLDGIVRYFGKDIDACARDSQQLFKTKRNHCFYVGKNFQVIPVSTRLTDDSAGNSYADRNFFN